MGDETKRIENEKIATVLTSPQAIRYYQKKEDKQQKLENQTNKKKETEQNERKNKKGRQLLKNKKGKTKKQVEANKKDRKTMIHCQLKELIPLHGMKISKIPTTRKTICYINLLTQNL